MLTRRCDRYEAATWHDAAMQANAATGRSRPCARKTCSSPAASSATAARFYTRSDRAEGGWTTVYLAADAVEAGTLALAAASVRPGRPLPWTLPEGGELTALVAEARAVFAIEAGAATPRPLAATAPRSPPCRRPRPPRRAGRPSTSVPAPSSPPATSSPPAIASTSPTAPTSSCSRATPSSTSRCSRRRGRRGRWLSLAAAAPARLGQRVHAAGFPYYAIAGTSLHLTGGNVWALAGIDDDARFFSFTAPVQPGN